MTQPDRGSLPPPALPATSVEAVQVHGSFARSPVQPQVELVGLPALPEAATSEPAGPAPTRVPAVAVGHAERGARACAGSLALESGAGVHGHTRSRRTLAARRRPGLRILMTPLVLSRPATPFVARFAPCLALRAVAAWPSPLRSARSRSHPTWIGPPPAHSLARGTRHNSGGSTRSPPIDSSAPMRWFTRRRCFWGWLARSRDWASSSEAQGELSTTHARAAAERRAASVHQGDRGGEARGPARRDAARLGDAGRARSIRQRSDRGAGHGRRGLGSAGGDRRPAAASQTRGRMSRGPSRPASARRSTPLP